MANLNETNVICPNCGARVAIPNHEHVVSGMCIAKDSGIGNVFLQLEDRKSQLEANGVDTSNYFSIKSPGGNDVLMKWENGVPKKADDDDPVVVAIRKAYVPNRRLFRRWVMAQMFRGLSFNGGFTPWMKAHGYLYTWKQVVEEFRVQSVLMSNDSENFLMRRRWFNRDVLRSMCEDYISQLEKYIESRNIHHCNGKPYKKIYSRNFFLDDIDAVILQPLRNILEQVKVTRNPHDLYLLAKSFRNTFVGNHDPNFEQCRAWQDAYKGSGAYFTLRNLIMFHGCVWKECESIDDSLKALDEYCNYHHCEGYEMLGALKAVIEENNIDIKAKMAEWKK